MTSDRRGVAGGSVEHPATPTGPASAGRRQRGALALLALGGVALWAVGCGGSDAADSTGGRDTTSTAAPAGQDQVAPDQQDPSDPAPDPASTPALPPGPALSPGDSVSDDELVINFVGGPEALPAPVTAAGGEIVLHDEPLGFAVVQFEVAGLDELVLLRDELRAAGVDAAVHRTEADPTA